VFWWWAVRGFGLWLFVRLVKKVGWISKKGVRIVWLVYVFSISDLGRGGFDGG